jgi:hypothetical protein
MLKIKQSWQRRCSCEHNLLGPRHRVTQRGSAAKRSNTVFDLMRRGDLFACMGRLNAALQHETYSNSTYTLECRYMTRNMYTGYASKMGLCAGSTAKIGPAQAQGSQWSFSVHRHTRCPSVNHTYNTRDHRGSASLMYNSYNGNTAHQAHSLQAFSARITRCALHLSPAVLSSWS